MTERGGGTGAVSWRQRDAKEAVVDTGEVLTNVVWGVDHQRLVRETSREGPSIREFEPSRSNDSTQLTNTGPMRKSP